VGNAIERNISEVRSSKDALEDLVRELSWEIEYNLRTGTDNPVAFRNFALLFNLLRSSCPLFHPDPALRDELSNEPSADVIEQLRYDIAVQLNRTHELFTRNSVESTLKERISEVHRILSEICEENIPKLQLSLNALSGHSEEMRI
jgi:hypothetical protein